MVTTRAYDMYRNSQVYEGMDPNQLILTLYKEALKRLNLAKEAIIEKSPARRGENIGKAIAIVSALDSCLDPENKAEEVEFLRGLYRAILQELPKVSVSNDIKIVDTSYRYILALKDIWEKTVMGITQTCSGNSNAIKSNYQEQSRAIKTASLSV